MKRIALAALAASMLFAGTASAQGPDAGNARMLIQSSACLEVWLEYNVSNRNIQKLVVKNNCAGEVKYVCKLLDDAESITSPKRVVDQKSPTKDTAEQYVDFKAERRKDGSRIKMDLDPGDDLVIGTPDDEIGLPQGFEISITGGSS